jgi:hypothetical protein
LTALQQLCEHCECQQWSNGVLRARQAGAALHFGLTHIGVVLRRYLGNNQLSGTLPASLGSLTALQQLCDRREQLARYEGKRVRLCTLD